MSLADCIMRLAVDHALPVIGKRAATQERLHDRCLGLFQLQEQGIVGVAGIEQQEVAACPHAAYADHLESKIDEPIALK
jgi:hypothetical protein